MDDRKSLIFVNQLLFEVDIILEVLRVRAFKAVNIGRNWNLTTSILAPSRTVTARNYQKTPTFSIFLSSFSFSFLLQASSSPKLRFFATHVRSIPLFLSTFALPPEENSKGKRGVSHLSLVMPVKNMQMRNSE